MKSVVGRVLSAIVLVLAGAVSIRSLDPPPNVDAQSAFDTNRARKHLEFIAAEPRPVGSSHHRAVREYLLEQFRSLGIEAEAQDARVKNPRLRGLQMQVINVVARLHGTSPGGKAVMLAAHYDSTPMSQSRGAGDDGAAVAAILEVARILAANPPKNDLIFLLTDDEELGMLGARAFVDEHRWSGEVGVVFNFEARGTRGPSIMFETSSDNRWLIENYSQVAPHPVAASLSYDLYKLMPNDTDFTIFRRAGMRGMNFAFIGGVENYHRSTDDLDHLDVRSMRHHGVQALALARRLGEIDLAQNAPRGDAIYFNLGIAPAIARYPASWALPLLILGGTIYIGALFGVRRQLSVRGLLWSGATIVMSIIAAGGLSHLLVRSIEFQARQRHLEILVVMIAVVALACVHLTAWLVRKRTSSLEHYIVALFCWLALAAVTSFLLRGASYLFIWPAMFGAAGLLACSVLSDDHRKSWPGIAIMTLASFPLVLILPPTINLAFLGLQFSFAVALVSLMVMGLWALMMPLRGWK